MEEGREGGGKGGWKDRGVKRSEEREELVKEQKEEEEEEGNKSTRQNFLVKNFRLARAHVHAYRTWRRSEEAVVFAATTYTKRYGRQL